MDSFCCISVGSFFLFFLTLQVPFVFVGFLCMYMCVSQSVYVFLVVFLWLFFLVSSQFCPILVCYFNFIIVVVILGACLYSNGKREIGRKERRKRREGGREGKKGCGLDGWGNREDLGGVE